MAKHGNFIGGEWRDSDGYAPNVNPSNLGDVIGDYARGTARDVHDAVEAADAAFAGWSSATPQVRFDVLDKAGDTILARKEELGAVLAREEGKTRGEGIGEATRAGQVFKWFAGEALRVVGERVASIRPGVSVEMMREPLGVIGIITPWNFPIAIPAWKIAPALAYGNCVVVKPADLVPASAWSLVEILDQAGLPKGALNLVMGRGSVVGEAILNHPKITAVTFTGSVDTGRHVAATCAGRLAKVQLEMGGKNPLVVLDDADLDVAVDCAVQGAYYSTGQRCTASSRLVVTEGIHDRFVDQVTDTLKALVVDDALKPGTQIGPVVDEKQLVQDLDYVRVAQDEGARLHWGGERLNRETEGFYMQPALFTETDNAMRINREEVFGPVASVIRVKDYDAALEVANDTAFGLSAGICTTSLKYAEHFQRQSQAGMTMVNLPTAGVDYHVPFGGRKGSSYGSREQGRYAAEFYTTVKTSYVRPV
ncbi:MAG: aldehyde dehydrogenase family protein [Pseudomonadota bacterium]